jgi:hypothetical protein
MISLAHYMKLCVITTKENKMHIEIENLSVLAKVTQVSDVAHGPLVSVKLLYPPQRSCGGVYWNRVVRLFVCRRNGFQALDHYPYYLESPYHTYRLPIGGRSSLLILRSKVRRTGHQSRNTVSGL